MTVNEMMEILDKRYGIGSMEEFEEAVRDDPGLDIGLFTSERKVKNCEQRTCEE